MSNAMSMDTIFTTSITFLLHSLSFLKHCLSQNSQENCVCVGRGVFNYTIRLQVGFDI